MREFTGERLVPGLVDTDLLNEHLARYLFAARLSRGKWVLDIACGEGYGAAELAKTAKGVAGIDLSREALASASRNYPAANLLFCQAPAQQLPFPDGAFDLITAFEVIEHLSDWPLLLQEAKRVLAPAGQFIISTPNRVVYGESRQAAGPNPFHVHEFDFEEFRDALLSVFPSVRLYLQNHVEGLAFQPCIGEPGPAQVQVQALSPSPEESHFFVAVCALSMQTGSPTYVYLPPSGNVLRERERHITKLAAEIGDKDRWLEELKTKHAELVELHTSLTAELKRRTEWAISLEAELNSAQQHIVRQDAELKEIYNHAAHLERQALEAKAAEQRLDQEMQTTVKELGEAVALLQATEATMEERTRWAQQLEQEVADLRRILRAAGGSRWLRLGRKIGLGPSLPSD